MAQMISKVYVLVSLIWSAKIAYTLAESRGHTRDAVHRSESDETYQCYMKQFIAVRVTRHKKIDVLTFPGLLTVIAELQPEDQESLGHVFLVPLICLVRVGELSALSELIFLKALNIIHLHNKQTEN